MDHFAAKFERKTWSNPRGFESYKKNKQTNKQKTVEILYFMSHLRCNELYCNVNCNILSLRSSLLGQKNLF